MKSLTCRARQCHHRHSGGEVNINTDLVGGGEVLEVHDDLDLGYDVGRRGEEEEDDEDDEID
jgi:hypothetical protein